MKFSMADLAGIHNALSTTQVKNFRSLAEGIERVSALAPDVDAQAIAAVREIVNREHLDKSPKEFFEATFEEFPYLADSIVLKLVEHDLLKGNGPFVMTNQSAALMLRYADPVPEEEDIMLQEAGGPPDDSTESTPVATDAPKPKKVKVKAKIEKKVTERKIVIDQTGRTRYRVADIEKASKGIMTKFASCYGMGDGRTFSEALAIAQVEFEGQPSGISWKNNPKVFFLGYCRDALKLGAIEVASVSEEEPEPAPESSSEEMEEAPAS